MNNYPMWIPVELFMAAFDNTFAVFYGYNYKKNEIGCIIKDMIEETAKSGVEDYFRYDKDGGYVNTNPHRQDGQHLKHLKFYKIIRAMLIDAVSMAKLKNDVLVDGREWPMLAMLHHRVMQDHSQVSISSLITMLPKQSIAHDLFSRVTFEEIKDSYMVYEIQSLLNQVQTSN